MRPSALESPGSAGLPTSARAASVAPAMTVLVVFKKPRLSIVFLSIELKNVCCGSPAGRLGIREYTSALFVNTRIPPPLAVSENRMASAKGDALTSGYGCGGIVVMPRILRWRAPTLLRQYLDSCLFVDVLHHSEDPGPSSGEACRVSREISLTRKRS